MKILDSFHSKTRVKGGTIDSDMYHQPATEDTYYDPYVQYPIFYQVKVQICLLCFIWITVWSITVEFTDEAVDAVNKRATELAETLSCTGV